jgi:hypothetical protein
MGKGIAKKTKKAVGASVKAVNFKIGRVNSGYPAVAMARFNKGQPLGGSSHRVQSFMRVNGKKSGYHEPLPTNLVLAIRKSGKKKTIKMGTRTVALKGAERLERIADAARTDTMSEAMRAKGGDVVGHTHSGLSTSGQSGAHDELREANSYISELNSDAEQAVAFASLAVTARAPWAEVKTKFANPKLTSGDTEQTYETKRNEAKERAQSGYDGLNSTAKKNVTAVMQRFSVSIGRPNLIPNSRSTSPQRGNHQGYQPQSIGSNPSDDYTPERFTMRATSPLRR